MVTSYSLIASVTFFLIIIILKSFFNFLFVILENKENIYYTFFLSFF